MRCSPCWWLLLLFGVAACAPVASGGSSAPPIGRAQLRDVFDPLAQVERRPSVHDAAPLRVLDVQPVDRSRGEPIRLRFDRPVARRSALPPVSLVVERQEREGTWIHVEGRSRWASTDRLVFEPEDPLPWAHRVRVRLDGEVEGISGVTWSFETSGPELEVVEDWDALDLTEPILLWSDAAIDAASVAGSLRVRAPGKDGPLRVVVKPASERDRESLWRSTGTLVAIHPARAWPEGATLGVELGADFRAPGAALGLGAPRVWSVQTRARLRLLGVSCPGAKGKTCPLGRVRVELSTGAYGIGDIRMVPEPPNFEAYRGPEGTVWLDGDFEPGRRYAIVLPEDLRDERGETIRGRRRASVRFSKAIGPGEASLELSSHAGIFATAADARVGILSERVKDAAVRVRVLDAEAAAPFLQTREQDEDAPWPSDDLGTAATASLRLDSARRPRYVSQALELGRWAKPGQVAFVEVRPTSLYPQVDEAPAPVRGVYRISGLGVWAHAGPARGVVRVTELSTGLPRAGVHVSLLADGGTRRLGESDADGLVALPGALEWTSGIVVASADDDAVAVPLGPYRWGVRRRGWCWTNRNEHCINFRRTTRWTRPDDPPPPPAPLRRGERALVSVALGRGLYLPGDTVYAAGWAGISTPYAETNTRRMPVGTPVTLTLRHGETTVATGRAEVGEHGRFVETMQIPEGAALGRYTLEVAALESSGRTVFTLAEPRLPTFEVTATPARSEIERGDPLRVTARATFLSGEAAPIERLDFDVACHGSTPWLRLLPEGFSAWSELRVPAFSKRGHLGGGRQGERTVSVETDDLDARLGYRCAVAVSAQDASRQPVGADTWVFVHPGPGYVAAKIPSIMAGEPGLLEAIVVDRRGRPIAAQSIRVELERIEGETPRRLKACEASPVPEGAIARCRTPKLKAGTHRVRVTGEIQGHPLELLRTLEVHRPLPRHRPSPPPSPSPPAPRLKIEGPDEVELGERVRVVVSAPYASGSGVLTVEQTGLRQRLPFTLREGEATLNIEPKAGAGEVLELLARIERPPHGGREEKVDTAAHAVFVHDRTPLEVVVVAPKTARPGAKTRFEVRVRTPQGEPVDARLAVWVVDDALHQLRGPARISLERTFNPHRPLEHVYTQTHDALLRPFVPGSFSGRGKRSPRVRQAKAQVKGALDIEVRRRFEPVPLFVGDVGTGDDGVASFDLRLGDDLTRFRIRAIASAELPGTSSGPARFGMGEGTIVAHTPLAVRAALPRMLRPGDEARIAAVVTSPSAGSLEVSARSTDEAVTLHGPRTRTRRVEAGEVVRVSFGARAGAPGEAEITLEARLRPDRGRPIAGGVVRPLAVRPERTAVERAAVYGSVDADRPIAVPVVLPEAARGSIDVAVTGTTLGELQDAADYLLDYPYGCVEQTSSRLIPLVAMQGLQGRVPDPQAAIAGAVAHLQSMQLPSGRFAYWSGSTEPSAFGTAYATWVLQLAREAGAMVPEMALQRALGALQADVVAALPPDSYGFERDLIERALAVRALAHGGEVPAEAFDRLWPHRKRLPLFARLLLLAAMHRVDPDDARIEPLLASLSASIETRAGVAHVVDPTDRGRAYWYAFSSPTRTEALALMTLLEVAPEDPRIETLVRGLRSRRRAGRWRNTQENAFALLALSRYAAASESVRPDARVQAWIGPRRVMDARLEGFDATPTVGRLGLARALADATAQQTHVVVHRRGEGRTHYRIGVEWTPRRAPARAQGLSLERTAPAKVRLGEQARIEITLSTEAPQHFVAVEVPLPPGLEAVDTRLGSGAAAKIGDELRASPHLSHHELRPDRVLLFFDSLPPGTTVHSIPVTASTPGHFALPAAVAEAMYEPETRARTARSVVRVEQ